GTLTVLVDAFISGGADIAGLDAAQLPHDPVGRLDPTFGALVDLGVLFEELKALGELPLAGDLAAVAGQPALAAFGGEGVDAVGLRLGGVVLPQFGPGVGAGGELVEFAQRGALG